MPVARLSVIAQAETESVPPLRTETAPPMTKASLTVMPWRVTVAADTEKTTSETPAASRTVSLIAPARRCWGTNVLTHGGGGTIIPAECQTKLTLSQGGSCHAAGRLLT